jgi:Tfp pilus assembly protein PilN
VRAVNLVPDESRRPRVAVRAPVGPGFAVLVLLAVAVGFVTLYVVTTNSISDRKAKLAQVQSQISQQRALVSRLAAYAAFQKAAQKRSDDVSQVATARFDWHTALSNIARVFPAQASINSLFGSASSTSSISGASGSNIGGAAGTLRNTSPGPAVEMGGCTKTQEDVANLMSRLRVVPGVTRVTLGDSLKHPGSSDPATGGCGSGPTFDLVVFFNAPPGSAPTTTSTGTGTANP